MKTRDVVDLLMLAAVWGASFLFMRIATPEFGPIVLMQLRLAIAALFLIPIFLLRANVSELKTHWRKLALLGVVNSAIPFSLLAFSTLYLTAGFAAIINATAPLWAALIAWMWLSERLDGSRVIGLLVGFCGVIVLVHHKLVFEFDGVTLAIIAALAASFFYGLGANVTRKYLRDTSSLANATGSMIAAAIIFLPGAVIFWPEGPISFQAWMSVMAMGVASTGIAYILYFRLIANVGPAKAISVTYLIPAFAVLWGAMFMSEALTMNMAIGCAVILTGTALATGMLSLKLRRAK
jgi:drug/metabolite transporter (DMT)-like permease